MRRVLSFLLLCAAIPASVAAEPDARLRLDGSIGAASEARRVAVTVGYSLLRGSGRWDFGIGARLSAYGGDARMYTNRDDVRGGLTSDLEIDPALFALNASVFGGVRFGRSVSLGANLDLIGLATGPSRAIGSLKAKPESFSYFLYGTRDRGSLNSEYYVGVRLAEDFRLRAGLSHYVTNYIVSDPGSAEARYQRFESVPFVAVEWRKRVR